MTSVLEITTTERPSSRWISWAGRALILLLPVFFVPVSATHLDFVWTADGRMLSLATYAAIFGMVAYGLSMLMRFVGLASVVHGALWGVGAYTAAILANQFDWGFWPSLPFAALLPAVVALVVGVLSLRTSGLAFIIVTLSLCEFLVLVGTNWDSLTNGPQGMAIFTPPEALGPLTFTSPIGRYYLTVAFLYLTILLTWFIGRSAFGRRLIAIRDNELLARSLGLNTFLYKLAIFTVSAAVVGVAGQLYLYHQQAIQPDLFGSTPFVNVLLMVVMGGTHVLAGPALGAWLVQFLPELLAPLGLKDANVQRLAYGVLLILFMIAAPQGIAGALATALSSLRSRISPALVARTALKDDTPVEHPDSPTAQVRELGDILLEVSDLRKKFGALTALDRVGFDVRKGEVLGIIGPNGSGKTTLFNCVSGLLLSDSGSVKLRGQNLLHKNMDAIARRGLVRTFQQEMSFSSQTVRGNVQLAMNIRNSYGRHRTATIAIPYDIDGLLAFCGLEAVADTPVRALSFGHARLLGVAMSLAVSPQVLMLDEPAAGLNHLESARLADILQRARNAGATLVVIDHDMTFLLPICERILVMDAGISVCEGKPAEIKNDPRVIEAYLGSSFAEGGRVRFTSSGVSEPKAAQSDARFRALQIRNLSVGYGSSVAVHELSLTVGAGEAVALLGANGAGKSTTLRALSGLLRPRKGQILWGDEELVGCSPGQILRAGIAHVPEGRMLFVRQTVEENLLLGQLTRKDRGRARDEMENLLDVFPALRPKLKQPAGQLSGGQQQMLAIARGLMSNPRLLMLDEPSLGLSPALVDEVTELIMRLCVEKQISLLLVEQNPLTAVRLTQRVLVLQNGRLRAELASSEVLGNLALLDTYLGNANMPGLPQIDA